MLRTRIIPVLLLREECLVKTINFKKFDYIGDPINTVKIFNELQVDELLFLDIISSLKQRDINYKILKKISQECFMPLSYGGGIKTLEEAKLIFEIGFEKSVINTSAVINPNLISEIASIYGSQSVIVSIDVKKNLFKKHTVRILSGTKNTKLDPVEWAKKVESLGAGEILITSIDQEGSWKGFNLDVVKNITDNVNIPVIAHGGAGNLGHIESIIVNGRVSAVGLGSMVVYQKKDMGVLINFPEINNLLKNLS